MEFSDVGKAEGECILFYPVFYPSLPMTLYLNNCTIGATLAYKLHAPTIQKLFQHVSHFKANNYSAVLAIVPFEMLSDLVGGTQGWRGLIQNTGAKPIFLCGTPVRPNSPEFQTLEIMHQNFSSQSASNNKISILVPEKILTSRDFDEQDVLSLTGLARILQHFATKFRNKLLAKHFENEIVCNSFTTFLDNEKHFLLDESNGQPQFNKRLKSPVVSLRIDSHQVSVLIDTGSEITLISLELFEELKSVTGLPFPTLPVTNIAIKGITGVRSKSVTFQTYIDLKFNETCFPTPILVVPSVNIPFIVGIDFLRKNKAIINCAEETLELCDGMIKLPWMNFDSPEKTLPVNTCSVQPINRIFLLTDSHGRDLSDLLKSFLPKNTQIEARVKPGFQFDSVTQPLSSLCVTSDTVVIIAGTNNLAKFKTLPEILDSFNLLPLKKFKGKIVMCEIFPRYDWKDSHSQSTPVNLFLKNKLRKYKHVNFLKTLGQLQRKHFTRQGLHLNLSGKKELAQLIARKVEALKTLDSTATPEFEGSPRVYSTEVTRVLSFTNLWLSEVPAFPIHIFSVHNVVPTVSDLTYEEVLAKINPLNLNNDQKTQLLSLIENNRDVFSDKPGLCTTFTAKLRLKNKEPFVLRSRPIPFYLKERVRAEVQRMLDLGLIERSSSPFSNPIVPVVKEDDSIRLCLDARKLNERLVFDAEAPESIESLLNKFSNPQYMSKLDCTNSFLQLSLEPESREFVSFVFEGKNYQFGRLPFGLCVSMQIFLKATETIFGPETADFLAKYVDDFKIVSQTFPLHLEHLQIILSDLRAAGMTLKFAKCLFLQESTDFVGYILSRDGIRKDPKTTRAISEFPQITNKKTLQSFLGLINFYSKFHNNHAKMTVPLHHLLKKDAPWSWGPDEEKTVSEIKRVFIEDVVLSYPDFAKSFYLNTDGSYSAVAGELFQMDKEGYRRPICYYSRTLTASEKNYTVTEIELLAIVASLNKFRQFTLGHKVIVLTDHSALTFLRSCVLSSGRLVRWSLFLQQYNLEIQHIKGSENTALDILSRYTPEFHQLPTNNVDINVSAVKTFAPKLNSKNFAKISEWTLLDPRLGKIHKELTENKDSPSKNLYTILNNNLFFKDPKSGNCILCIPQKLESEIIFATHEYLGHLGSNKVYQYLKRIAIFPKMQPKIRQLIRSCLSCQQSKVPNKKATAPMVPVLANSCLELVSVDLYGPLPKSFGNFNHILVALDIFSKYVTFTPVRSAKAVPVTRAFITHFVNAVGKPLRTISDHGPCFRSHYWDSKLKELDIEPRHTSVYHPQSNPVERYMRILGNFCRIYCHENHKSWVQYLKFFEQCLNSSVSESSGFAPIEVLKGCPPDNFLQKFCNFPPYQDKLGQQTRLTMVQENLTKSAIKRQKQKKTPDPPDQFQEGMQVLLQTHHLSSALYGEIKKFFRLYEGPYSIKKRVGHNAFELEDPASGGSRGVHNVIYLRKFHPNLNQKM